ncbi:MAG TPA: heavy metal transporter [Clostridiales bacterium]|nr:heavy metal transporter [Clostridiales bacterium]
MSSAIKNKRLRISGMTCISCQQRIDRSLRKLPGIHRAKVSYNTGLADVSYDPAIVSLADIIAAIEKAGYQVVDSQILQSPNLARFAGLLLIVTALYFLLQRFGIPNLLVPSQLANADMSYGMLFVIGLLTSVHCVAMCGGINLSQCLPQEATQAADSNSSSLRSALLYNAGRVISYTIVGFIVGALGSALTLSNPLQGVLKIIAGVFMVIMGINMLGLFPWLRRLSPHLPRFLSQWSDTGRQKSSSPLVVGLLNGLMPCGPLQAMQIYALSTGHPLTGALSMLIFSLGTVPLMFSLGALTSALGKKFTRKIMTAGAVLVVVLGLAMFSQGWTLSGLTINTPEPSTGNVQTDVTSADLQNGVQQISSTLSARRYPDITVQAGRPVRWLINAPDGSINGCNNRMIIQAYGIEHTFKPGENVIEFTPSRTGQIDYSCWMGMITATITVVD